MQYPTAFNPAKIVEKAGSSRPYLSAAHLDTERSELAATNGHCLVLIPVTVEPGDVSGPVTVEALKAASKLAGSRRMAAVSCNGAHTLTNGAVLPRPTTDDLGRFPDYARIIPELGKTWDIALNAELLANVQKAFGADGIRIQFAKNEDGTIDRNMPLRVSPIKGVSDAAIGVLMPMRD